MTGHRKILLVSHPTPGHINPSLTFAARLREMGVHVTISTSFSVLRYIIHKQTTPHGLTFALFSDGHDNGKLPTTTLQQFTSDLAANGACAVADIITSADQQFDHMVYTTGIPWAATVATAYNLKCSLLWCQPATVLDIYYYYFNGYEGLISGDMNKSSFSISLPGLPLLTIDDLPSFLLPSRPKELDCLVQDLKDQIDALKTTQRILVTSFNKLETESIKAIKQLKFLPIGPLVTVQADGIGIGIGKGECMRWLNTKSKASVVYVAFGSVATLSMEQVEEIASGLLKSGQPFLWVIRDSEQAGRLSQREKLRKQGMIVQWCCQVAVLNHGSVGCFVTHCGWNSTMEALAAGVPSVVFPQWSDQPTNAKMVEDVWKTGVRVKRREGDGVVEGKEIHRCVEMVMAGGEMRRNAHKWRDLATEALNKGGSSTVNLQAFLDDV